MTAPIFTLIVPYYRAPRMLEKQYESVRDYPASIQVIVVDNCSPEPASDIPRPPNVDLYRIDTDIPWNRGGARNLGVHVATTPWIIHVDIDHILSVSAVEALIQMADKLDPQRWYRFPRWRVGAADETRKKDALDPSCVYGQIKPHIDSHLMTREMFWRSPYDEYYSGCLGGGSPFLHRMEQIAPVEVLPEEVRLHVYTRYAVPDASVSDLSRDTSEYSRRRKAKEATGDTTPIPPLNFEWHKV